MRCSLLEHCSLAEHRFHKMPKTLIGIGIILAFCSCWRFVPCQSMNWMCCFTTSQKCSIRERPGVCGGHLEGSDGCMGKIPLDQQLVKKTDLAIWRQQTCHIQSHANNLSSHSLLSSIFSMNLTMCTSKCFGLLSYDYLMGVNKQFTSFTRWSVWWRLPPEWANCIYVAKVSGVCATDWAFLDPLWQIKEAKKAKQAKQIGEPGRNGKKKKSVTRKLMRKFPSYIILLLWRW